MKEHLENDDLIAKILTKYDKKNETKEEYNINRKQRIIKLLEVAQVDEETYYTALKYSSAGYSYHQERDLDEIYINSYNPEWLRAWDGNIDIQPCFDHFGIITYCIEYYAKRY